MISPARIAELRKLDEAATKAPWCLCNADDADDLLGDKGIKDANGSGVFTHTVNFPLIAAARNALPELLDAVEGVQRETDRLRSLLRESVPPVADHNQELHKTEPELYHLLTHPEIKRTRLGHGDVTVGFCTNSDADGYSDASAIWIHDDITDPVRAIDVCIHESLHYLFPQLPELGVEMAGEQIASLIAKVFRVKGEADLPKLRELSKLPPLPPPPE